MIVVLLALILFALLFPGVLRFLFLAALALVGVLFVIEARAATSDLPVYDVEAVCRSQMGGSSGKPYYQDSLNQCVLSEQALYDELKDLWPIASESARSECLAIIHRQGGYAERKYGGLELCIRSRVEAEQRQSAPAAHFRP